MTATLRTDWFWSDWLGDQEVRRLTPAERGVWIDLLALAAGGTPTGYVCDAKARPLSYEEIARVTNAGTPTDVARLIDGIVEKGAASRDRSGRLFNRRMVRDSELRAKRSRAGKLGAAHTNLITKDVFAVTRQMTQHMTRQNKSGPPRPLPKESKITTTLSSSAREGPKEDSTSSPARSLATALPTAELAREPCSEQVQAKRPSDLTRKELEAHFERKRAEKIAGPKPAAAFVGDDLDIPQILRRT